MAEDDDRPEDEIEDPAIGEDDSDLFEPPSRKEPAAMGSATEDPLSDALAEAAIGDTAEDGDAADLEESPGEQDDDEDDSELFDSAHEDEPAAGGHQPVLPIIGEDEEGDAGENDHDADLFGEEEDEDGEYETGGDARQRYPWLQTSGEEEEEPEEEHSLQGRTLIFVGAGVVSVIFAALIWFLYSTGDEPPRDEDVALIEAPEGPAKVEPEDRGGLEVPDQDKLVFDRVSGQETELDEKLLEGPEEPVVLGNDVDPLAEEAAGASMVEGTPAEVSAGESPVAEEPEAIVEPAPAPAQATPAPAAADLTHVVQLASYGSAERADTGWRTIKNRHSIRLAGLDNDIQRADLGARGVVYRLRTEPLGLVEAQNLCADLKAAGQDCLVVRR